MPSSSRPDSWARRSFSGPAGTDATTRSNRCLDSSACVAYDRHGSLRLAGATRADGGALGTLASTRPPHANAPTPAAATIGRPATMLTAAPAPNSTMPSGDIIARATRGVKKRSRNDGT